MNQTPRSDIKAARTSDLSKWESGPLLDKVLGVVPQIIYVFNHETQSNEYSSQSIGEFLGYSPQDILDFGSELMGRLAHCDDLSRIGKHFEAIKASENGEVLTIQYRMRHKDGHWRWLLSRDTVFQRDEDGNVVSHLGNATDITEQREIAEQMETERKAALYANAELQTFAYSVSHDIKSPANTLNLLLDELVSSHGDLFDESASYLLDLAQGTIHRMQSVITDTLEYTRVIGEEIERSEVDVNRQMSNALADLKRDLDTSRARVEVGYIPPLSRGISTQIHIMLLNVLDNAIKYRDRDRRLKITIEGREKNGECVIEVRDNGIGIAKRYHSVIFEMFKRLHAQEDYPGTGLGLSIARRVAKNHGGTVTVKSEPNVGSTFTMTLKST